VTKMDNELRQQLVRTIFDGASLEDVAKPIASSQLDLSEVYVERRGFRYRWSPAHRGGPYPLHRVVAKLIDVPHHDFPLPFTTVDGRAIVRASEGEGEIDAWSWIEARGDLIAIAESIEATLGSVGP
jgi:hypothetical protein